MLIVLKYSYIDVFENWSNFGLAAAVCFVVKMI